MMTEVRDAPAAGRSDLSPAEASTRGSGTNAEQPSPEAAEQASRAVWQALDLPAKQLACGAWVLESGAVVVIDDEQTRISYLLRRNLAVTPQLLAAVAQLNQTDPTGNYWLIESTEMDDRWTLVWAATMPHAWTSAIHLQRVVHTCLTERVPWIREYASQWTVFGGTVDATASTDGEQMGLELWEITSVRASAGTDTAWPAGWDPAGQQAEPLSAVEHDESHQNVDESHLGTSFPPHIPIPIRAFGRGWKPE